MNRGEHRNSPSIRRIMVALDASPQSREIIDTAAKLAARFGSQLVGLFVEDINLLKLTELPFVREVGFFSPVLRVMDRTDLERQLRAQAAWMRRLLGETADRLRVPWEFRVARGLVAMELLTAGKDADLLIMGKVGRSFLQRHRVGSTVRTLLLQRPGLTMIFQGQARQYQGPLPVIAVYEGSELSRKALYTAFNLVDEKEAPLRVLILAPDQNSVPTLRKEIGRELEAEGVGAETRTLIEPNLKKLARALQMESGGAVVIPCDNHVLGGEDLCTLMEEIPNPVLVVRRSR